MCIGSELVVENPEHGNQIESEYDVVQLWLHTPTTRHAVLGDMKMKKLVV